MEIIMNWINIGCSILALGILSGCATTWDVKLNAEDNASVRSGQEYSYNIVDSKTMAIDKLSLSGDTDPVAIALFEVFKAQAIAGIETPYFKVQKARLNTDNVGIVADVVTGGIPFIAIGKIVADVVDEIGDETYESNGGDINVEKSEVHTTALGDGNEVGSGYVRDTSEISEVK